MLTTLFPARFEVLTAVFVSFLVFGMWRCRKYSPNNAASHTRRIEFSTLLRPSGVRYSLHTVTFNKFCVGSYRVAGFILQTLCFRQLFLFVRSEQRDPRLLGLLYKVPLFFGFFFNGLLRFVALAWRLKRNHVQIFCFLVINTHSWYGMNY